MTLNTYRLRPAKEYEMEELEKLCTERLHLYVIFEQAKLQNHEIGSLNWFEYIKKQIEELQLVTFTTLLNYQGPITLGKARRNDNVAHWMLGLGYSSNDEMQQAFAEWELQWFHLSFMNSTKPHIDVFIETNNFNYTKYEINEGLVDIEVLKSDTGVEDVQDTTFYRSIFTDVLEAVGKRQVHLFHGQAIIAQNFIVYCLKRTLKKEFLKRLANQRKIFPTIPQYQRIKDFLTSLPIFLPKRNYETVEDISVNNIDEYAAQHYPICMKYLHERLRSEHHLKYECKMQLGVFLYWLGLPYQDALKFWREEFTKKIDMDLYKRKYEYLFKHQYGKVGHKKGYDFLTCQRILANDPLANQHHGCPFKHWNKEKLSTCLEGEIHSSDLRDIEDLVDEGCYQTACTKFFCSTRNLKDEPIDIIDSPNKYVTESLNAEFDVLSNLPKLGEEY